MHQIGGGSLGVDAPTFQARIGKGAETDLGDGAGFAGGNVAEEVDDDALGEVVAFDLAGQGQLTDARGQSPVTADHAAQQALVTQMIEAATFPVALPGTIDQGEAARPAGAEKARLQAGGQRLRVPDPDEPADRHGVASSCTAATAASSGVTLPAVGSFSMLMCRQLSFSGAEFVARMVATEHTESTE